MKLDLAAVEATDCAIDGTVNWASLADGRGLFCGTAGVGAVFSGMAAAGAAGLDLDTTGVGMETGRDEARGVEETGAAGLGASAWGLTTGLALAATGLAATLTGAAALAGVAGVGVLPADLAATLAAAAGFTAGELAVFALAAALADAGLLFTTGLLVAVLAFGPAAVGAAFLLWDGSGAAGSARECTGFPKGKPMSCKIETIMPSP